MELIDFICSSFLQLDSLGKKKIIGLVFSRNISLINYCISRLEKNFLPRYIYSYSKVWSENTTSIFFLQKFSLFSEHDKLKEINNAFRHVLYFLAQVRYIYFFLKKKSKTSISRNSLKKWREKFYNLLVFMRKLSLILCNICIITVFFSLLSKCTV